MADGQSEISDWRELIVIRGGGREVCGSFDPKTAGLGRNECEAMAGQAKPPDKALGD